MSRNIKLVLEYDGTNYHGWQAQAGTGRTTVQEALERALQEITNERISAVASGRTDAGVHAFGQVVNFHTRHAMPPSAWMPALNHRLPADIRVIASAEAPAGFHARHSARGKVYRYRILNRSAPSALFRNYAWHVAAPLKLPRMRKAASQLVGTHDFSAFQGAGCGAASPVRTLARIDILKRGDFIELHLEANAFLQYMVRNITGTLVETGLGRFSPEEVSAMLASRDRRRAGRTAPPHGLYLISVRYEEGSSF